MWLSHEPVLLEEVIRLLAPKSGGIYLDGTVGGGGHAVRILEASSPDGLLVGIDRDPDAVETCRARLAPFGSRVHLFRGEYDRIDQVLDSLGIAEVDGVLLDLGVSSHQLDTASRGFSFQNDGPLDMRMDREGGVTAADLVGQLDEDALADIIHRFGEERMSRRIARAIVSSRVEKPIVRTAQLAEIVRRAVPARFRGERIDPATRTFQALRIAVNRELEILERGVAAAIGRLKVGGRMAVISFHSLEDRIVKEAFRSQTGRCRCPREIPRCVCGARATMRLLTRRPVTASDDEAARNRRSRSARLRVAEKIA